MKKNQQGISVDKNSDKSTVEHSCLDLFPSDWTSETLKFPIELIDKQQQNFSRKYRCNCVHTFWLLRKMLQFPHAFVLSAYYFVCDSTHQEFDDIVN